MRRANLRVRILILLAGVALVSAGATAWITYVGGRDAIEASSFDPHPPPTMKANIALIKNNAAHTVTSRTRPARA